jgi:hypothetical protein
MDTTMSKLADVIATRTLQVLDAQGSLVRTVQILIGRPTAEQTGEWGCPYQILGIEDESIYRVYGTDSLHAIQCALTVIGGTLLGTEEGETGRLRWQGEHDLGFPAPPEPPPA